MNLDHRQAGADGMDSSRRIIEEVAGSGGPPVDHFRDAAIKRRPPEPVGVAVLSEADAEFGTGAGVEHQPTFVLPARKAGLPCHGIVGMGLNRQPFRSEKEFDHQRRGAAIRILEPYLADTAASESAESGRNIRYAPRLLDNAGARSGQHRQTMPGLADSVNATTHSRQTPITPSSWR